MTFGSLLSNHWQQIDAWGTRRFGPRWISGYITFWITGWIFFIPLYGILRLFRKIEVIGYAEAEAFIRRGRGILAPNHPDGWTVFLMTLLFWRQALRNPRFCIWNMPRKGIMPSWAFPVMRCIPIDRQNPRWNVKALDRMIGILTAGGIAMVFPETTRTYPSDPDPEVKFVREGERVMRVIDSHMPTLSLRVEAPIKVVWIQHMPRINGKPGFWSGWWHILKPGGKLTVYFGEEYMPREGRRIENPIIQKKIMRCGLPPGPAE